MVVISIIATSLVVLILIGVLSLALIVYCCRKKVSFTASLMMNAMVNFGECYNNELATR